jgi:hypothetical protein
MGAGVYAKDKRGLASGSLWKVWLGQPALNRYSFDFIEGNLVADTIGYRNRSRTAARH